MKSITELIKNVESSYEVERVLVNGVPIWPFYKIFLFDRINVASGTLVKLSVWDKLRLLKHTFQGIAAYRQNPKTLAMSYAEHRKLHDSLYMDKLLDGLLFHKDLLGEVVHLELPVGNIKPMSQIPNPNTASRMPLRILEFFFSKWSKAPIIVNGDVLVEVNKFLGVDLSIDYVANRFQSQYLAMRYYLRKKTNIKFLFTIVPYMNFGALLAAKEKGIQVVEVQHGVVSKTHYAYYYSRRFDVGYLPDLLLTFGEREHSFFETTSCYLDPEQVIPIGHFYLESILSKDSSFTSKQDNIVVAVSVQDPFDQFFPFFIEAAKLNEGISYRMVLRRTTAETYQSRYAIPKNMILIEGADVYQEILNADIHATLNSTCAIEALSLGTPNVLANIEGRARAMYEHTLTHPDFTKYANSPSEMVREILNAKSLKKLKFDEIRAANSKNIKANYHQNLRNALRILISK